jgi:pimeloyl-ACP methyl ester carboxylesterase
MTTTEAKHRIVATNGIRMHIAEQGSGPTVLLCHGFPECWYSWRHQLRALAANGFHAVAPDMRGYGQTDAPQEIERYTLLHMVGYMVPFGVPALYIAGDRDPVVKFPGMDRHIADLPKFVPQLRGLIMLPGCGHITQEERPTDVNTAMVEFIRGLP